MNDAQQFSDTLFTLPIRLHFLIMSLFLLCILIGLFYRIYRSKHSRELPLIDFAKYIGRKKGTMLLLAVTLLLIIGGILDFFDFFEGSFKNLIPLGVDLLTLCAAIAIGIGESQQDYENDLPKRLTTFCINSNTEEVEGIVYNVVLIGESDVRAWSQSLCRTFNGADLVLEPFSSFEKIGPSVSVNEDKKQIMALAFSMYTNGRVFPKWPSDRIPIGLPISSDNGSPEYIVVIVQKKSGKRQDYWIHRSNFKKYETMFKNMSISYQLLEEIAYKPVSAQSPNITN